MNIPLSLLFYNPIEAYIIMLLCDVITGNNTKLSLKRIVLLYLYGTINLIIQVISYIWYGRIQYLVLNIIVSYIIAPLLLKLFYPIITGNSIVLRQAIVAMFILSVVTMVISNTYGMLFDTHVLTYNDNEINEFVVNLIIFSVQISLYKIIIRKMDKYEKHCKKYR